jgi:hypothetical protein
VQTVEEAVNRADTERQLLALMTLEPGLSVGGLSRRSGLRAPFIASTLKRLEGEGRARIENVPEPEYDTVAWRCWAVGE